jgi:hypothetical protein
MCTVSMVGDHYRDKWVDRPYFPSPVIPLTPGPIGPVAPSPYIGTYIPTPISRQEFDELKKEVLEMKELLKRAKKYDEDNGEKDCEIDEKMDLLRRVAKLVDINLDDVIARKST